MSVVIAQMVRVTMTTNYYEWEGVIYQQQTGAPAGLSGSSPIRRIVMDAITDEVRDIETNSQIMNKLNPIMYESLNIHLLSKYVDDCLYAGDGTKPGTTFDQETRTLKWDPNKEKHDKESGLTSHFT